MSIQSEICILAWIFIQSLKNFVQYLYLTIEPEIMGLSVNCVFFFFKIICLLFDCQSKFFFYSVIWKCWIFCNLKSSFVWYFDQSLFPLKLYYQVL